MKQHSLFLLAAAALPVAAELPPDIPSGPVTYESVSYQDEIPVPEDPYGTDSYATPPSGGYDTPALPQAVGSSERRGYVKLNAFSTNYQVRGMGVTDALSHHGFSSVEGSCILPNRNLFNQGFQFRIGGALGAIWGAEEALGDAPMFNVNCGLGKELFPNLTVELGYGLNYGGLEGYMSRYHDGAPHRVAQNMNLSLAYDDHQQGVFGHALVAGGFQGLNGFFVDAELGYRKADLLPNTGAVGVDAELSAGFAPSFGYWAHGADGIDAYRIKLALEPFSRNGAFGRDAHFYVKPWVQCSWSGSNAKKIHRTIGYGPVDHFQLVAGVDVGCRF